MARFVKVDEKIDQAYKVWVNPELVSSILQNGKNVQLRMTNDTVVEIPNATAIDIKQILES